MREDSVVVDATEIYTAVMLTQRRFIAAQIEAKLMYFHRIINISPPCDLGRPFANPAGGSGHTLPARVAEKGGYR